MTASILKDSPLFAFATALEFSRVFPEESSQARSVRALIPLRGKFEGSYACILGVGLLDFSVGLSKVLMNCTQTNVRVSSVINVGVCGAYPGRGLNVLDVVCVASEKVGDFGCEELDGSVTVWKNLYRGSSMEKAPDILRNCLLNIPQVTGATVNCCTGTEASALQRIKQLNCDVESMEGAACFAVCESFGISAFQIRAVSNIASTRDKSKWKIKEALEKLHQLLASGG